MASNLHPTPWPRGARDHPRGAVMSQLSKMRHSRNQWQAKAIHRGERQRSQRKENARLQARYPQVVNTYLESDRGPRAAP
jgi:hypothetical protein